MRNQDFEEKIPNIYPSSARTTFSTSTQGRLKPGQLKPGLSFYKSGHWWEIDGCIKGKENYYYKCKPLCNLKSRFYTEMEIKQAIQLEAEKMQETLSSATGRGTGRLHLEVTNSQKSNLANIRNRENRSISSNTGNRDSIKVMLIGSRKVVKRTIQNLHSIGFAHPSEWSAFQNRPDKNEVLSILIQRI